jgi:solute:Na+ symporter, SSS family
MLSSLSTLDTLVLVGILIFLTGASFWAGLRRKDTEEDYFMAGRSLRWWSVAGSIYGTNVSANQIIGMLGVGYTIGFAQSHYEVLAIFPILVLAYIFVPIYRKKEVFTLSQFLASRYDDRSQTAYALLNILFILVQLIGFFYLGSRQLILLSQESALALSYGQGIVLIACVTCLFTVIGGMESVVIADNIQTVLMVMAAILVGVMTFAQPEIGGFAGLLDLDASLPRPDQKMHLYLPPSHPDLPWSGAFTGLMLLHFFYWTTNQYQVQRVLAAASDYDAKIGVLAAGFLKLTIPFFSVAAGVAAAFLFRERFGEAAIKSDDAFLRLMALVVPAGVGLQGLILAGLISAIFSTIYSMMNSLTTMLSVDIYLKFVKPNATEKQTVTFGRIAIVLMCALASYLSWATFDPSSNGNFFLMLSRQTSYLKPGIVVAFFLGILWRKSNPLAAVVTMLAAPVFGIGSEWLYDGWLGNIPSVASLFGTKLNFMHRVLLTTFFCILLQVSLTMLWQKNNRLLDDPGFDFSVGSLKRSLWVFVGVQTLLFILFQADVISQYSAAWLGGAFCVGQFWLGMRQAANQRVWWQHDLFWAGILTGTTVWILYWFV